MKKLLIIFLIFSAFQAQAWETVGNNVGCGLKENLDDILKFVRKDNKAGFTAMILNGQCIMLNPGVKVTVLDNRFIRIYIKYKGTPVWTYREAVKSE